MILAGCIFAVLIWGWFFIIRPRRNRSATVEHGSDRDLGRGGF